MTKVKLKDATRDLLKNAESVLANVNAIRKAANKLNESVQAREVALQKEEDEKRSQEKLAEQQRLISQHTKAFTMPDTDEPEMQAAEQKASGDAPVAEHKPAPVAAPKAEEAPKKETAVEAVPAAPAAEATQKSVPTQEKAAVHAEKKPEAQDDKQPKAAVQDKPKAAKKAKEEPNHEPAPFARPRVEQPKEEPKPAEEAKPAAAEKEAVKPIAQPARPAQPAQAAKPQQAQQPRPQGQNTRAANPQQPRPQGPYGRPANPQGQQGPYGRPANPQGQQGPYGRPANPQGPYGRPANPQGQQGPYGRPANPQGPYGRPANPQGQQGPYGRPANPQGPYGRPANPQGPYGRPANPQGQQGQFGRPANAQGGFARPAGGQQGGQRPGGFQNRPQAGAARGKHSALEMTPTVEKERVSNYDPNKKNYDRPHDPERVTRNRKQLARENYAGMDDDVVRGGRKARLKKQPSAQQMMQPIKIENAVMTAETITVRDLTERIGKPAGEILKQLLMLGVMATINSELDYDTAALVCSELGVELELNIKKNAEDKLAEIAADDEADENLQPRPPVVTIMGHVDHGKTTLLDHIRDSHVTAGEAGGITQHIGAYTVNLDGKIITFLDTPGHEAFTAMRARGAQATDIAILVVAADDGVMPQTVEAINHAKAAGVPIIVAINKMDKPTANPDRVKQDLTSYELICEDWGGDTIMVPVSAATGEGVDNLLEMILLQADMLELRANPNRMARGVIIEAKLDKARGPMATVLLQSGTLHVGDNIVAGMSSGRVRAMMNDRGERVTEAGPSMPVEITGFAEVPSAGDDMMAVADDHLGRQVVQERRDKLKAARVAASSKVSLDNLFSRIDQSKQTTLNIIIKADVQGSVEAVKAALEKLSTDEVKVRVLFAAVGAVTRDDVNLASASDAIIIGFNIRPDSNASDAAKHEGVDIRLYRVIYQAIEDIEKAMKGLLDPEYREVLLGHAEVRSTFRITGAGTVAGCYVKDGKMQRNAECRLLRDNVIVHEGKLNSLKRFKDDAKEVAEGYECGISFDGYNDIKENDIIECFIMEEIER